MKGSTATTTNRISFPDSSSRCSRTWVFLLVGWGILCLSAYATAATAITISHSPSFTNTITRRNRRYQYNQEELTLARSLTRSSSLILDRRDSIDYDDDDETLEDLHHHSQ